MSLFYVNGPGPIGKYIYSLSMLATILHKIMNSFLNHSLMVKEAVEGGGGGGGGENHSMFRT